MASPAAFDRALRPLHERCGCSARHLAPCSSRSAPNRTLCRAKHDAPSGRPERPLFLLDGRSSHMSLNMSDIMCVGRFVGRVELLGGLWRAGASVNARRVCALCRRQPRHGSRAPLRWRGSSTCKAAAVPGALAAAEHTTHLAPHTCARAPLAGTRTRCARSSPARTSASSATACLGWTRPA
jgi:hypothetical protein